MAPTEQTYHLEKNNERLQTYNTRKSEAETKVIQTLFVLNTGVFAAVVGRSTSADLGTDLRVALFCSAAGIFALLLRATWAYYRADYRFLTTYHRDLSAFYNDEMGIHDLLERDRARSGRSHVAHGLAIVSGILWIIGSIYGLRGIARERTSPPTGKHEVVAPSRLNTPACSTYPPVLRIHSRMTRRISPEIWEAIKIAHAAGIGLREFARNHGIPEGTILSYAKRKGLTQEIATAKVAARPELARSLARPDAIDAITPLQSVTTTMVQRGQRHVERMAGVTEKVLPHLESMAPEAILEGVHEIEKFDKMARRNYGLGDGTIGNGTLNVQILAGQAAVSVSQS